MRISSWIFLFGCFFACSESYTPKPRAFFKFDLPAKEYERTDANCSFSFEKPIYSILRIKDQDCFFNLEFPNQKAVLHITYLALEQNLLEH